MSNWHHATSQRIEDLLFAAGALERGHFLLQGGQHSGTNLQTLVMLRQGTALSEIAQQLAARSREVVHALGGEIDLVVGVDQAVAELATLVAEHLGVRSVVAGDAADDLEVPPRARVLLVAGELETGTAVQVLLPTLYAAGAHPIAAVVIAHRTQGITEIEAEGRDPIPLIAGVTLSLPTYEPRDCPLCAAGEPIVAPGSSGR